VVTNQKGVAKGLTTLENLLTIHKNMVDEIRLAGGKIDKVYFCGDLDETSPNRKPNPGMGLQAKNDFPEIDFQKAIIVGNTFGDMEFGRNLGIKTIFLPTTKPETDLNDPRIDCSFNSLNEFALAL
jgi:histidinol phosphatase-like enzyme